MRAPFQILGIPYRIVEGVMQFCVFHRADGDQWQFISGGGEDAETPTEAAKREIFEEAGIDVKEIIQLTSMTYIPSNIFAQKHLKNWGEDTFVIPEYSFGFKCDKAIILSHEHTEYLWLTYEEACTTLKWDSNRTALYELMCRLERE